MQVSLFAGVVEDRQNLGWAQMRFHHVGRHGGKFHGLAWGDHNGSGSKR